MNIVFTPTAWEQYTDWQNGLLNGIGKPEPLKYRKACSRRITDEHRLVYNMDNNQNLITYSCK